jgi:hypothetical protein
MFGNYREFPSFYENENLSTNVVIKFEFLDLLGIEKVL